MQLNEVLKFQFFVFNIKKFQIFICLYSQKNIINHSCKCWKLKISIQQKCKCPKGSHRLLSNISRKPILIWFNNFVTLLKKRIWNPKWISTENTILTHFWVSSEFQGKKLEETVSSRQKKPWKKNIFFPLWKKLANPAHGHENAA